MNVLSLFEPITTFVFDIDGVLTDGMLLVQEEGELLRSMNIKDGHALQLAIKQGYHVWVISGGKTEAAKKRLQKLGVHEVHVAVQDKPALLQQLIEKYNITKEQMVYMGDDMPDIAAMQLCQLKTCPADAATDVQQICQYISPIMGGKGCVRDIIEKVLKLDGKWY